MLYIFNIICKTEVIVIPLSLLFYFDYCELIQVLRCYISQYFFDIGITFYLYVISYCKKVIHFFFGYILLKCYSKLCC